MCGTSTYTRKRGIADKMESKETREELRIHKGIIEVVLGVIKRCFAFEYVLTNGLGNVKTDFRHIN